MDATIKSTDQETIIRLANGCTVTIDHKKETVSCWAPGSAELFRSKPRECDDLSVRDALSAGLTWHPQQSA